MWGNLVTIAQTYELKIVGPCMTKDAFTWYNEWLGQCDALYPGVGCHHDAVCIHMYMQPHPCDTSKVSSIHPTFSSFFSLVSISHRQSIIYNLIVTGD